MSFNWEVYKQLNPDLEIAGLTTATDYIKHFVNNGKPEGRPYNIYNVYPEFNHNVYRLTYPDLKHMNKFEAENHWLKWGKDEGRKCSISTLYPDFNHHNYRNNYSDLEYMRDSELEIHWIKYGKNEGRIYQLDNNNHFKINIKSIKILNNPTNGYYLFNTLLEYFKKLNINANIVNNIVENDNAVYFIPFGHLYKIPASTKYILYQLEQKKQSKWLDESYINKINKSVATFDYSYANINAFSDVSRIKCIYIPIPLSFNRTIHNNVTYDILFYGSLNARRESILSRLKRVFNIKIISGGIFGSELNEYIKKCKIILNIHYYDNALLETTRLNECLKYNKRIISEKGNTEDAHNNNLYSEVVDFVDIINNDLSNIDSLINKITYYLNGNNYILNKYEELNKIADLCYSTFKKEILNI